MRLPLRLIAFSALSVVATASPLAKRAYLQGIDVSNLQGTINWSTLTSLTFAYIKATEGTGMYSSATYDLAAAHFPSPSAPLLYLTGL